MASRYEALEDSQERVVEDTVFVALGKDVKECRPTLMWSLGNSGGKRICILHVHQPAQRIPAGFGASFPASLLNDNVVREYREIERQKMHALLDKYLQICRQNGVKAQKLYIETSSIEKGIVDLISQHGIRQLVMGATAEKDHPKKMMQFRISKVKYVREQAPLYCQIQFICKGHLTFTREASAETETGQSSHLKSQSFPLHGPYQNREASAETETGQSSHLISRSFPLPGNMVSTATGVPPKYSSAPSVTLGHNVYSNGSRSHDIIQLSPEAFINGNAHFSGEVNSLLNELIVLDSHGYHLSSLPSNFHPKRLIDLRKPISLIPDVRMEHANLTVLNLSSCELLTKIPNLSRQPNLKELILSFCTNLEEIHDSVGLLDKLVRLDLCHCSKVWSFPRSIKLRSLEDLELGGCSSLQNFPEIEGEMKNLYRISLYGSGIKELPSSIRNISRLRRLDLTDCKNLTHLPDSILQLSHLLSLSMEGCPQFRGFGEKLIEDNQQFMASIVPNSTWKPNLSKLVLSGTNIVSLPASIKRFVRLRCLHLENCKQLQEIPELPRKIKEVHARGCISLESFPHVSKKFQFDTSNDSIDKLIWLDLSRCHRMLKKLSNPVLSPSLRRDLIGPVYAGQEIPTSWFYLLEDYVLDGIADSGSGLPTWFSHSENSLNANRCRIYVDWQESSEKAITIALCAVFVFRRPSRWTPEMGKVNASVVLEGLSPRHVEGTTALIGNESTWGPQHLFLAYATVKPSELKGNHLEVKFSASTDAGAIEIASCEVHRVDEHKERVKVRKKRNENKEGARTKDGRRVLGEGTDVQMDLSKAEPENLLDLLSTIQLYQSSRKGQLGKQYTRLIPWQH